MENKLYCKIEKRSLRYDYFLFVDVEPYLADGLLVQHGVRVWFDREFKKDASLYIAILCHVRKKDTHEFLAVLEELKKSMLICGYTDYEYETAALMNMISGNAFQGI